MKERPLSLDPSVNGYQLTVERIRTSRLDRTIALGSKGNVALILEIKMSEEVKSKAQVLREELDNLKMALQTAAGGMDEQVQVIVARMEAVLAPTE